MASTILKSKLPVSTLSEWRVESAGVWGMDGRPPASGCRAALEKMGLDVSEHKARTVSRKLMEGFNLILTMEQGQKEALRFEFPDLSKRIYLITEMVGLNYDVKDPMGGSTADFEDTAFELVQLISEGFGKIEKLALQPG
jgi:protein-tyrosine-phosphatase